MYVPLHLHTKYSFLDGLICIDDLVEWLKTNEVTACAITDHNCMWGVVEFYQKLTAANIKPIIGCEFYVKDVHSEKKLHITLLAKNNEGYYNLLRLYKKSFTPPRDRFIDLELMEQYSEGIICLTGCLSGHITSCLTGKNKNNPIFLVTKYMDIFKNNLFVEIMPNSLPEQVSVNDELIELANKFSIPVVMTCDSHYIKQSDSRYQDIVRAISFHQTMDNNKYKYSASDFWLLSYEEILSMVKKHHGEKTNSIAKQALKNTINIARSVSVDIDYSGDYYPKFSGSYDYIDYNKIIGARNFLG